MGIRKWIGRPGRAVALLAIGVAGGGAAIAVGSVPDSSGVIHACVELGSGGSTLPSTSGANLRVIDSAAGQTCSTPAPAGGPPGEATLDFNATGPRGIQGPPGPAGAPGKSITVANGHTITLAGGDVITVAGASNGLTIASPPLKTTGPGIGEATLGTGSQAIQFAVYGLSFVAPNVNGKPTGSGAGKPSSSEITITKKLDKASPSLSKACVSGKHIRRGILTVRKAGSDQRVEYKFSDVLISSIQVISHGDQPVESVSLNFTKVEVAR